MHHEMAAANVVSSGEVSNSSKLMEKKVIGARKVPVFGHSG
jgi:hypothetical protein